MSLTPASIANVKLAIRGRPLADLERRAPVALADPSADVVRVWFDLSAA